MTLLIVTPLRNEATNVPGLIAAVRVQTFQDFRWIAVDDGSTDGTGGVLAELGGDIIEVLRRDNDGGLMAASEYGAWHFGIRRALAESDYSHIMKLDADVRLAPDYLERVMAVADEGVGVAGGVIASPGMREQKFHVPGPVKLYSAAAYEIVATLPAALGLDVLDETAAELQGLRTVVDDRAQFTLARSIGASEGRVQGRYRNGRVCRWSGYFFPYFLLHNVRYAFRAPFAIGALAQLWGYFRAGPGPFSPELKRAYSQMQRYKLLRAVRNPLRFWREGYAVPAAEAALTSIG